MGADDWPGAVGQLVVSRRRLLGGLGAGGLAAAACALAACDASVPARRQKISEVPKVRGGPTVDETPTVHEIPTVHRSPADALDVRDFGARGDGRADDSTAIASALEALRPAGSLVFPAGTYRHSRVLSVAVRDVTLVGPGRLLATAEQASALRVDAPGVTIRDLTVAMGPTTRRWSSEDQHKIFLGPHSGITVSNVNVEGSAAAGLFCYGADHFRFSDVRISDTRADGLHMTNGAHDGEVNSPSIMRSGDDGVAVVSYVRDPAPCHDINVFSPRVFTTTGGRGVSVVGGHDIAYRDVQVDRSHAASVYVACEGAEFVTRDTMRVTVEAGVLTNANTNPLVDQGAVLVFNGHSAGAVEHVLISGLTVTDTRATASRQIGVVVGGPGNAIRDVVFRDLRLAAEPMPYQGNAPTSDFALTDVRAAGALVRVTP